MSTTKDIRHLYGQVRGIESAYAIALRDIDFHMCPESASEVVRSVRMRVLRALMDERRSVLTRIRIAKRAAARERSAS